MIPKTTDSKITIHRDRTYSRIVNYKAGGVGVNVSNIRLIFSIRKPGSADPFFILTVGDAETANGSSFKIVNIANGVHHLLITHQETKDFSTLSDGVWSVSRLEGDAKIWMYGGDLEIVNP